MELGEDLLLYHPEPSLTESIGQAAPHSVVQAHAMAPSFTAPVGVVPHGVQGLATRDPTAWPRGWDQAAPRPR